MPRISLLHSFRCVRRPSMLAAALLLAGSAAGCEREPATVVFGLAGPLSENYGRSMRMGAELAAREINDAGGINGRTLRFRAVDDAANPERAVRVAEELFDDPDVLAVVGHVHSDAMIEAAGIYGQGLPAVATSATSPALSALGPWVFRVASSDSANAVALARAVHATGRRTAVLYENDGYGRGLAQSFRSALRDAGGEVLETNPYLASTEDHSAYLERLRRRGVQTIFVAGLEQGAARIIDQAQRMGMEVEFVGGDGLEGLTALGSRFDGTKVGMLFHPEHSPEARGFAERFRAEYGREADSFAALGYDAVHLLARAAAEGGRSRGAIRDYLAQVGTTGGKPAFAGVAGTVRFDANGDPMDKDFAIGTIRGGRITLLQESVR